jgi:cyanophycinase
MLAAGNKHQLQFGIVLAEQAPEHGANGTSPQDGHLHGATLISDEDCQMDKLPFWRSASRCASIASSLARFLLHRPPPDAIKDPTNQWSLMRGNCMSTLSRRGRGAWMVVAAPLSLILATGAIAVEPQEPSSQEINPSQIKGSLVVIGGAAQRDNHGIWEEIVDAAGGEGAEIAVIPAASSYPERAGNRAVETLEAAGADAFLIPIAPTGLTSESQATADDPEWVEKVRRAHGVYFCGGAQDRICQVLFTREGKNSPMLNAIWEVYRRGGVVAGSSAGAAIMSRVMFRDASVVLATMVRGVNLGKEIDRGLGFLDGDWFVDQHFLVRGRFARSLVAMQAQQVPYGIGVDEDSAIIVRGGSEGRVVGQRGAVFMDLSQATSDNSLKGFNIQNVKLSYLNRGDELDLETLELMPAPQKLADRKIDPTAPDFTPSGNQKLVFNDILANSVLPNVMRQTVEHRDGQAIGLAFDGAAAQKGPTTGFEFRFYRDSDSRCWETGAFGGTDYTIQNIHLDIRPIEIRGPLYSNSPATTAGPMSGSGSVAGGGAGK